MRCILCRNEIDMLYVGEENEELAIDCKNPICVHCYQKIMTNGFFKRAMKKWEKQIAKEARNMKHFQALTIRK
jgi:hypothetical protein